MTSKEFFNEVFVQAANSDGVSKLFKVLMNEMCEAVNERNEELAGKKSKKPAKSIKTKVERETEKSIEKSIKAGMTSKKTAKTETKKSVSKAKVEAPDVKAVKINKRTINKLGLQYIDYNEKSFAIIGDTKPIKEELKSLKGRFNGRLTVDGERVPGWIFAKRNAEPVKKSLYIA